MPGDTVSVTSEILSGPNRSRVKALATTNLNTLQLSSCNLYAYQLYGANAGAANRYVKFYDKATVPVVGTDIPAFIVPLLSFASYAAVAEADFDFGVPFKLGLHYAITGGVADSDTTVCVADDVHGVILWK